MAVSKQTFRELRDRATRLIESVGRHRTHFLISATGALLPRTDDDEQDRFDSEGHQNFVRDVAKSKAIARWCVELQDGLTPEVIEAYDIAALNRGVERDVPIVGGCLHHWGVLVARAWLISLAGAIKSELGEEPPPIHDDFLTDQFWDELTASVGTLPAGAYARVAKHACDLSDETLDPPNGIAQQITVEATAAIADAPMDGASDIPAENLIEINQDQRDFLQAAIQSGAVDGVFVPTSQIDEIAFGSGVRSPRSQRESLRFKNLILTNSQGVSVTELGKSVVG